MDHNQHKMYKNSTFLILSKLLLVNLIQKKLLRWQALVAVDIAIEVVLILLSFFLVWNLQMGWQKKGIVVLGFTFRLP